jgi:hypothetical protein
MGVANERLAQAYTAEWIAGTSNSRNCSGFLKSAAQIFGFSVPDRNADGIINELEQLSQLDGSVWEKLGTGQVGLSSARQAILDGRLVIAAATSIDYGQNNGHIAVLVPKFSGPPHDVPFVYGGAQSEAARSAGDKTLRQVWNHAKHHVLRFYAHRTIPLGSYD